MPRLPETATQIGVEKIPEGGFASSVADLRRARYKCVAPASRIQLRAAIRSPRLLYGSELGSLESVACGSPPRRAYPPRWSCGREAEGGGLLNPNRFQTSVQKIQRKFEFSARSQRALKPPFPNSGHSIFERKSVASLQVLRIWGAPRACPVADSWSLTAPATNPRRLPNAEGEELRKLLGA
jgi:hypothetical protein